jgi:hypothetical protein
MTRNPTSKTSHSNPSRRPTTRDLRTGELQVVACYNVVEDHGMGATRAPNQILRVPTFLFGGGGLLPSYASSFMFWHLRKKFVQWMLFSRS